MASYSSDLSNVTEVRETLFKIQKNLECPICLELLSDPYTTQCSHPFCRACICKVISASKVAKCPLCKVIITKRSLTENRRLGEIVEAVKELEQSVIIDCGVQKTPPRVLNHTHESTGTPGMIMHSLTHPTPIKPGHSSSKEGSNTCSRSGKTIMNDLMAKAQPSTSRSDLTDTSTEGQSSSKTGLVIKRRRKVRFKSSEKNKKPSKLGHRTSTESVCSDSQHRRELLEALEEGDLREANVQRLDELETENRKQNVEECGSSYEHQCQLSSNVIVKSSDDEDVPAHSTSMIYEESERPLTSVTEIRYIAETPHQLEALAEKEHTDSLTVVTETPFVRQCDGETITDRETPLINNTVPEHTSDVLTSVDDPTYVSNLPQDTPHSVNSDILARETQLFSPPSDSLEPIILAPTQPSVVMDTQPTSNLSDSNTQESSISIIENLEQSMKEDTVGYCRSTPDKQSNPSTIKSYCTRETHSQSINLPSDQYSSPNIPLQNTVTIYNPSTTESLPKTRGVAMVADTYLPVPSSQATPLLNKTTLLPQLNQCLKPTPLKPSVESNTSFSSASSHSCNSSPPTPHFSPELSTQELETLRQLMAEKEREVLVLEAMLLQEGKPPPQTTTTTNVVRESHSQTISENVENRRTFINTVECSKHFNLTEGSQETKKDCLASSTLKSPVDSLQVIFETQFTGHSHEEHTATEDEHTLRVQRERTDPESEESMNNSMAASNSNQASKRGRSPNVLVNNTEPSPKRTKINDTSTEQELSPKTKRIVQLDSDDLEDYSLPSPNAPLTDSHPFMSVSTIKLPTESTSNSSPKPQQEGSLRLTTSLSMLTTPQQGASRSTLTTPQQGASYSTLTTPQQRVVVQTPALSGGGFHSPGGGTRHTLSLVGSGLSKLQLRLTQRFARTHNGRIASVFNCHTTHVVVSTDSRGLCPRTVKYLQGVLARIWVLSYQWVEDSVGEERLLPEERYEVNGDNTLTSSDTSPRVPANARLSRLHQEPGLFSSRLFYLHCDFNGLSKDQLSQLLCLGGGEVVECVRCDAVTVCDCVDRPSTSAVSSSWILDCISSYAPL